MEIRIKLTNVDLVNESKIPKEKLEKAILEAVGDALMKPFERGTFLRRFTGQVKIKENDHG